MGIFYSRLFRRYLFSLAQKMNKKNVHPMKGRTQVRGATQLRLLIRNPHCDDTRGCKASLTHLGYGNDHSLLIPFTLITVASPAQATRICFRPATPRSIRYHCPGRFSPYSALCAVLMIRTIPLHSLCIFVSLDYTEFRTNVKRFS
jgi:hypothetical protein